MSANSSSQLRGREIFQVFDYLRFPLIIAVVFIHSPLSATFSGETITATGSTIPYASITAYAISQIIARIAVPLFFFMSGYLFFRNFETWSWPLYFSKLKKRVKSLLIPYIFWNLVIILGYYIVQSVFPNLFSGNNVFIRDYTTIDFLKALWGSINFPLWFIKNLMILCIIAPIIWIIIYYTKIFGLITLGCYFIIAQNFLDSSSIFFFTAGAYMAIFKLDIIQTFFKREKFYIRFYTLLALTSLILMNQDLGFYVRQASIVIGIPAVICLVAHGLEKGKLSSHPFLTSSSFFVFAAHGLLITFISKGLFYVFCPTSQLALLACYFGQVILTVFPLLGVYYILRRFFPKFTAVITGGR